MDVAVRTVDYHTGGEPFRIVPEPPVEVAGATVAERRVRALAEPAVQHLRRLLCSEPRGHADMYGGLVVPPDDAGAALGVLFWHKDGFSTACGHGTIALGRWAVDAGIVDADPDGATDVVVDVPSGRVTARVHSRAGRVRAVDFVNVASYPLARAVPVATRRGTVAVDLAFGGATYAVVAAAELGLAVEPAQLTELIAVGREIKHALDGSEYARHPGDDRLSGVYGTILVDDLGVLDDGSLHQRNVTVFADGEVDRSPCGSGTCARLALLDDAGALTEGQALAHDSIVGSRFVARVAGRTTSYGHRAVLPVVTGTAFRTGEHAFVVDPDDDLVPGFVLR